MADFGRRFRLGQTPFSGMLQQWIPKSRVRSVQRFTITLTAAASGTATITAVDLNHSVLRWLGTNSNAVNQARVFARLAFTNATTITASRGEAGNTTIISGEVTEYWPGVIRSVQRGTIASAGGGTTGTITAVQSLAKSTVDNLGCENNNNVGVDERSNIARLDFTNTTTITMTRDNSGADPGTLTVGFQAIEWW